MLYFLLSLVIKVKYLACFPGWVSLLSLGRKNNGFTLRINVWQLLQCLLNKGLILCVSVSDSLLNWYILYFWLGHLRKLVRIVDFYQECKQVFLKNQTKTQSQGKIPFLKCKSLGYEWAQSTVRLILPASWFWAVFSLEIILEILESELWLWVSKMEGPHIR